jgi:hypothetical protein
LFGLKKIIAFRQPDSLAAEFRYGLRLAQIPPGAKKRESGVRQVDDDQFSFILLVCDLIGMGGVKLPVYEKYRGRDRRRQYHRKNQNCNPFARHIF